MLIIDMPDIQQQIKPLGFYTMSHQGCDDKWGCTLTANDESQFSGGEDDSDWWIKVGDTGPGLPARAREHLFTAFQGGARKGGSGLGLAISAELVRGHGGRQPSAAAPPAAPPARTCC
jgi:hypothetical protein